MDKRELRAALWDARGGHFCEKCGHEVIIMEDHTSPECKARFKAMDQSLKRRGYIR